MGQNIIEASWEALCDAYIYGLVHADGPGPHQSAEVPESVSV